MKTFNIPGFYRSPFITKIKEARKQKDPRKIDFSPTLLDFGPIRFYLARHFGFCYGVENAIEISYRTVEENPGKRIFLLSEMIHNPGVNNELISRGVKFLMDAAGKLLINWDELNKEDIIIIPAFGTTIEIQSRLNKIGINPYKYNTTCPFVEKVWNRSHQLGENNYTVIVHGKHYHEETRATFSHSLINTNVVIVKNIEEAEFLSSIILNEINKSEFYSYFNGKYSDGFDVNRDLDRIGVVNQTTMLASETQAISDYFKNTMLKKFGEVKLKEHFADTKDTLCYATNDNQEATYALLNEYADFAIVVGGYNSSNTSHIVELCEKKLKTFFISSAQKIISDREINHYILNGKSEIITENYLPRKNPVDIILTSGASCPDAVVDEVLHKLLTYFEKTKNIDEVLEEVVKENT
ncbi:MAG: 4-hydroxy-3-methylbut-2-enyl diphosphate reductase [Ignavibacteriaceae bacterium]